MDIRRKLKQLLLDTDLNEKEIQVYLAILKNKGKSIYSISKKSKIAKDQVYNICEKLKEKKLISYEIKSNSKILYACELDLFLKEIKKKGRKLNRTAESLSEIKEFLPLMHDTNDEMTFENYSREQAGSAFVDLSYLDWDYVLAYGDFENVIPMIGSDCDLQFVKNRVRKMKKCFPIVINPGEYCWKNVIKKDNKELRKTRIVYDKSYGKYFVAIFPGANTLGIWMKDENGISSCSIIKNKMLVDLHRGIYDHFDSMSDSHSLLKKEEMN